ncbi:MAG: hypothetical protein KIS65_08165, partial [Nitrosomonas sp.]|nr:hypothetical protein [Nitrosomonas sp.]
HAYGHAASVGTSPGVLADAMTGLRSRSEFRIFCVLSEALNCQEDGVFDRIIHRKHLSSLMNVMEYSDFISYNATARAC